jgi:hypothetical protein
VHADAGSDNINAAVNALTANNAVLLMFHPLLEPPEE